MAFGLFAALFILNLIIGNVMRMMAEDSRFDEDDIRSRGVLANTKTTDWHMRLIFGRCRVGINIAYVGTTGEDNRYLHYIGVIGEGPIEGMVYEEDSVAQLYLDGELWTKWGSEYVYFETYNGTSTQNVCSTLNGAIPEWTDPLRYTSYIYLRLKFDQDKWVKKPDVTLVVDGLLTDEGYYTDNAARCTHTYMTRSSKRGGMGIGTARFDSESLDTAANYCGSKGWTFNAVINQNDPVADNLQLILNCWRGAIIYSENTFKFRFSDLNYEGDPVMSLTEDDILESAPLTVRPNSNLFSRPNCVKAVFFNSNKKYIEDSYSFPDSTAIALDGDYREREIKLLGLPTLDLVQPMSYYYLERWRWGNIGEFGALSKAMRLEPLDLIEVTHSLPGWDQQQLRVLALSINAAAEVYLSCLEERADLYDDEYNPPPVDEWHDTTLPDPLEPPPGPINISHEEEVYYYRGRSFTRWKIDFDAPDPAVYPFWDYCEVWVKIGDGGEYRYMTKSTSDYVLDPVEEGETYYVKLRSVSIFSVKENFDDAYVVSKTIVGKTVAPSDLTSMTAVANGDTVNIFADPVSDPDIQGYEVRLGDAWDGAIFISFNMNCSLRLVGVRPGTHTFWMSPRDNSGNYSDNPVSATVQVFVPPGYTQLPTYGSWAWDFNAIGTHDNTEHTIYDTEDALMCSHGDGVLSGTWESPTRDLGAIEKVRLWGDFRHDFLSTETTWDGVVPLFVTENIDAAAAVDYGSGRTAIQITGTSFETGDVVGICGTRNYNGTFEVLAVTEFDQILIQAPYVEETFSGTETASTGTTWLDVEADTKTWNQIFNPTAAGIIRAKLKYSDTDADWESAAYFEYFEILCAEVEARYVRVEITIIDPTQDAQTYLRELNMYAYEGPQ